MHVEGTPIFSMTYLSLIPEQTTAGRYFSIRRSSSRWLMSSTTRAPLAISAIIPSYSPSLRPLSASAATSSGVLRGA